MQNAASPSRRPNVLATYLSNLSAFSPNSRRYLYYTVLTGASMGVYRLLFNFYLLSLGYERGFIGNLVSVSSLTALIVALPIGYLGDRLGRKPAMLISGVAMPAAILIMILLPFQWVFIVMNVFLGLAQSLSGVTTGPFLMENSTPKERTYLFSFALGFSMLASSLGNWLGGYLPTWLGLNVGAQATSQLAYALSLLAISAASLAGVMPVLLIKSPRLSKAERADFAPFSYIIENRGKLSRLVTPTLITSIGAGLIMPFMNVFFRVQYRQTDSVIGTLFALGSLAMGIGMVIAPPLADKLGKIQLVVLTQGLSIPFLILLGFSPWFGVAVFAYYIRAGLMNMSGPVYQSFVMEQADPRARATVASLSSMSSNFGWAVSPTISGYIQESSGFSPVFILTIILYCFSIYLYWAYFWRGDFRKILHKSEPETPAEM